MPLSHDQTHKLQEWMASRGINRNCPMCGSGRRETGEIDSGTSVNNSGNVLPMGQLVCGNCGYVMMFAAMPIGLV